MWDWLEECLITFAVAFSAVFGGMLAMVLIDGIIRIFA